MLVWFVWSVLIFSLLAPLFRRMRDTFPQFEAGLKISPPSGKTIIDLFDDLYTYFEAREDPLSALRATLPEGESCFRRLRRHLPRRAGTSLDAARHSSRRAGTSLGAARHSPRRGKLFPSAAPTPSPKGSDLFRRLRRHLPREGKAVTAFVG